MFKKQNDDLDTARGAANGLILSLALWAVIVSIFFLLQD